MLRQLLARARRQRCDEPDRAAKFQRDENRGKIGLDSGRRFGVGSFGLHDRLQSGSFATSLWQSVGRYPPPHRIFQAVLFASSVGAVRIVKRLGSRSALTSVQVRGIDTVAPDRARGESGATAVAIRSLRR